MGFFGTHFCKCAYWGLALGEAIGGFWLWGSQGREVEGIVGGSLGCARVVSPLQGWWVHEQLTQGVALGWRVVPLWGCGVSESSGGRR